jgi:hypothetical protein
MQKILSMPVLTRVEERSTLGSPAEESKTSPPSEMKWTMVPDTSGRQGAAEEAKESQLTSLLKLNATVMRGVMAKMSRGRVFRTRTGYIGAITTSAAGVINASINCSTLGTTTEFSAFQGIFDEFFIHSFTVKYEPNNQFFGPCNLDAAPFVSWSSTALIGAPVYHGAPSYASASDMINNVDNRVLHTGKPWSVRWNNNEDAKSTVLVSPSTSLPVASQGWCLFTGVGLYTGFYQLRTSLALPFTSAKTMGQTIISFDVSFRARV